MQEATRVKLLGAAELQQTLLALGEETATKIGVAASRKAAVEFRNVLRTVAPYAPRASTVKYYKRKDGSVRKTDYGHLRDNIRVRKVTARTENKIVYYVTVGAAFWGQFLEFGTAKMAARRWMGPALNAVAERLIGTQQKELAAGIERAARRLTRIGRGIGHNGGPPLQGGE